jgi:hypothetical protein
VSRETVDSLLWDLHEQHKSRQIIFAALEIGEKKYPSASKEEKIELKERKKMWIKMIAAQKFIEMLMKWNIHCRGH